jgi:RHS repeat-associated protein
MNPTDNYSIKKTYIYGNSQILAQHTGPYTSPIYYYLHNRLGSIRQIINSDGVVICRYTYEPFGQLHLTETQDNTALCNPFKFTGQYFDLEIGQYYLRARMYDPYLGIFTAIDPACGYFETPRTWHEYLYCLNDPVNKIDPLGLRDDEVYTVTGAGTHYNLYETEEVMTAFREHYEKYGFIQGSFEAFYTTVEGHETYIERLFGHSFLGKFDYKGSGYTFTIDPYMDPVKDSEFGNYLAGFAGYYYWGAKGVQIMTMAGEWYSQAEYGQPDELASKRWIARGVLGANLKLKSEGRRGFRGQLQEVLVRSILWNINIMSFENDFESGKAFYYAW